MKIYTKTGDKGKTSLVGGERVSKADLRVEAYGTSDEANSMIGFALSFVRHEDWEQKEMFIERFLHIQRMIFHVGAELSTPKRTDVAWPIKEKHITQLERYIDEWNEGLPELNQFILPFGHEAATALHVARTIVRRLERLTVRLNDDHLNPFVLPYVNRLSDFLFVAARYINYEFKGEEHTLFKG